MGLELTPHTTQLALNKIDYLRSIRHEKIQNAACYYWEVLIFHTFDRFNKAEQIVLEGEVKRIIEVILIEYLKRKSTVVLSSKDMSHLVQLFRDAQNTSLILQEILKTVHPYTYGLNNVGKKFKLQAI